MNNNNFNQVSTNINQCGCAHSCECIHSSNNTNQNGQHGQNSNKNRETFIEKINHLYEFEQFLIENIKRQDDLYLKNKNLGKGFNLKNMLEDEQARDMDFEDEDPHHQYQ